MKGATSRSGPKEEMLGFVKQPHSYFRKTPPAVSRLGSGRSDTRQAVLPIVLPTAPRSRRELSLVKVVMRQWPSC